MRLIMTRISITELMIFLAFALIIRVIAFANDNRVEWVARSVTTQPPSKQDCSLFCEKKLHGEFKCHWRWQWQRTICHNVTRQMMRWAKTNDPQYPFLHNASSISKLSVFIPSDILRFLEDGFLRDYPTMIRFEISMTVPRSRDPSITVIGQQTFDGAVGLDQLVLCNCKDLYHIDDGAFEMMEQLSSLIMEENGFTSITYGPFRNLPSLRLLSLRDNLIRYISHDAFKDLTVSPYSSMEDSLQTQYCVGTKYEKIEILCLDKIF